MTSRVLIVDDSQSLRELLRMIVEGVAVVVGECDDGGEALDAYIRLLPDWVLMDVEMKNVNGITATRQILAADPNAKVIIVTDHHDADLRRAAFDAGAMRYVVKDDLLSIVEILNSHART